MQPAPSSPDRPQADDDPRASSALFWPVRLRLWLGVPGLAGATLATVVLAALLALDHLGGPGAALSAPEPVALGRALSFALSLGLLLEFAAPARRAARPRRADRHADPPGRMADGAWRGAGAGACLAGGRPGRGAGGMRQTRAAALMRVDNAIARSWPGLESDTAAPARLEALLALRERLKRAPSLPLALPGLARALAYLALPLATWSGKGLVEVVLERLFRAGQRRWRSV